ncbi:hypothetical protein RRG08_028251, partial [Elysia crispata]
RTEVLYLPKDQTRLEIKDNDETVDSVKIEPLGEFGLLSGAEIDCFRC